MGADLPVINFDLPTLEDLPDFEDLEPAVSSWHYRPYQEACDQALDAGWDEYPAQMITLATGTGKTVVFARQTQKTVAKGGRVLILAHTDKLLEQAADKLRKSTGLNAEKEKAEHHASLDAPVVVGSVQTLCRQQRLLSWPQNHFDLVIVDECHRTLAKGYQNILLHFGEYARVLGVTATPDRGDKKNLLDFYHRIAFNYTILDAVRDGWLVRPIAKTIPIELDLRGQITRGQDLDLEEVSHRIEPFLGQIAAKIREVAPDKRTVLFMPSIDTAQKMADALCAEGLNADYVSGECPDQDEKIAAFDRGDTQFCCNAMLLLEGFDCPAVDCVVILRPTKIRSLYVQGVGRGTRPAEEIVPALNAAASREERRRIIAESAKPSMLILDFLWLTEKLDLVRPAALVVRNPAEQEFMPREGDLAEAEEQAHRDFLKSLEKAVAKNKKKKGRTIDPLTYAVSVDADDLKDYEPESRWDRMEPTELQVKALNDAGIDASKVPYRGLASRIIERVHNRREAGLCSVKSMNFLMKQTSFLEKLGLSPDDVPHLDHERASKLCQKRLLELEMKGKYAR